MDPLSCVPHSPQELGFQPEQIRRAHSLLNQYVESGKLPGAVALVGRRNGYLSPMVCGWASVVPERRAMHESTVFDMASVTKVVATTTAVLQLLEAGEWRLDDPVHRFWPEFHRGITLRHLLTHTSGLPAWRPLYETSEGPEQYRSALESIELEYETGSKVVYSCLGFLVLGGLVELITGMPFDQYCTRYIFGPLGMSDSHFNPLPRVKERCAATEWRAGTDRPVQGVVHDENARGRGGVAGNAGLFSTAKDMGRFCLAMLNGGSYAGRRILGRTTVELATRDHTPHLDDSRGLGWVVKASRTHSSAGDLMSPAAFGHTGFTGTSLWIDPVNDLYVVLLTNRVHPTRENSYHIRLRALFHNAVVAALL